MQVVYNTPSIYHEWNFQIYRYFSYCDSNDFFAFDLQCRMINGSHQQHGIWGDCWYTGQLTPAAAHAFHARDAPQSKLSFRQFRQHRTEPSSLSSATASSRKCRWTPARGKINKKLKKKRNKLLDERFDTLDTKYLSILIHFDQWKIFPITIFNRYFYLI